MTLTNETEARARAAELFASLEVNHARSYEVRTFGCQMNVHDSERMS
ncbi:MAG: hypothetical protein F2621_06110, partial [Actinobacteria bacterium]|nr:hypothetical protein [Actinomycetota bacterium]